MDLLNYGLLFITTLFAISSVAILTALINKRYKTRKNLKLVPIAGGAWPIIGHLPILHPSKLPHKVLSTLADIHGPIFRINYGVNEAIVVSSSEIAKECLTTHDKTVSGRPKSIAVELMSYNYAMFGFGPYGSYWRTMRKISMLELLSNHRVSKVSYVWKSEINTLLKKMYDTWNNNTEKININGSNFVSVDMKQLFGDFALEIMVRIISGKQSSAYNNNDLVRFHKAIVEFFKYLGSNIIGDAFPWLRRFDLSGEEKVMKRVFRDIDDVLECWLKEHKAKEYDEKSKKENEDFMDVMLSVLDNETTKDCDYDADTINKATCLTMMAGGVDTTTVSLTWALSLLMNNPRTLAKAKEELTQVVGKERQVTEKDISKLEYLQAIIKETFRLYPPGPLMGFREFIEDCTISGYDVKKGTRLIINLHKIFLNSDCWESPTEFRPERFLESHKNIDVKGQHFELFPFGAGRRMCPGYSFALQVLHLSLANVLHGFDYLKPNDAPIDMSESFGLTSVKKEPFDVLICPSLPSIPTIYQY